VKGKLGALLAVCLAAGAGTVGAGAVFATHFVDWEAKSSWLVRGKRVLVVLVVVLAAWDDGTKRKSAGFEARGGREGYITVMITCTYPFWGRAVSW
jgi:hypothetical protein